MADVVNFEFLGSEPIENVVACMNYKMDKVKNKTVSGHSGEPEDWTSRNARLFHCHLLGKVFVESNIIGYNKNQEKERG